MMQSRKKPDIELKPENHYSPVVREIEFVSSGCTILDCVLGQGWPLGRICNIIGDKSTAKTALATEAVINFLHQYPDGTAYYRETEAAFDRGYALSMGLPIEKVDFGDDEEPITTIEAFARDVGKVIETHAKSKTHVIYVLDSLDAVSDEAEMERDIAEGTYGTAKPKGLSIFFRKTARKIEQTNVLLLIVSQVRENIGVSFGEKYKRSGGKALDFYASICLWLAHTGVLKRTISKVERAYGVTIAAKTKKNKVAPAFRECEFQFIFNYGVDDLGASIMWLKEVGRLDALGIEPDGVKGYFASIKDMNDADYRNEQGKAAHAVRTVWAEIEQQFKPRFGKYK